MFKKLYDTIIKYIKENYIFILVFITSAAILNIPLPYLIVGNGGVTSIKDRVVIENEYKYNGKIYASYVSEYQGNVFTYLLGKVKHYDFYKVDKSYDKDEDYASSSLMYNDANNNAVYVGYLKAGKDIKIVKQNVYVEYIYKDADTDLKIGDQILSINNINISNVKDINKIISELNVNDRINIRVKNNKKTYNRYANVIEYEDRLIIGITCSSTYKFNYTDYKLNEEGYGPSAGLMTSLLVYNKLTKEDITKGMKVAGTGTIDIDSNVGAIGGIKWKVIGASKKGVDVFFVPSDNYSEAIKTKRKYNLDIKLVKVSTFDDALNYLKQG